VRLKICLVIGSACNFKSNRVGDDKSVTSRGEKGVEGS